MIDTDVGILNVPELEALVLLNVDLADLYQAIADDPDAEPQTRQTAEALAAWRRARARYFQHECAETERVEALDESDPCTAFGYSSRPTPSPKSADPGSPASATPRSGGAQGREAASQRQSGYDMSG
jgi:hypothetical protein